MYRKVLALLVIIIAVIYVGYIAHDHAEDVVTIQPSAEFTPITEAPPETIRHSAEEAYDFITFQSEHLLDIKPILQMPDYPTGCELISLTMVLSYITGETVDTDILIDDYITITPNDFINGFMGDPRTSNGGGCFPPFIAKCANEYLADCHMTVTAQDASVITRQEILDSVDNGLPVLMWTTMYMEEPVLMNNIIQSNGKTYRWYISEHCLVVKGYNLQKNVFILNDPLQGEIEYDIDKFMEISDFIGNLAVTLK